MEDQSNPWSLFSTITLFCLVVNFVNWEFFLVKTWIYSLLFFVNVLFLWYLSTIQISTYFDLSFLEDEDLFLWGMFYFLLSEVMFFFGWFWSFHSSELDTSIFTGDIWPPFNVSSMSASGIPLLNTILLLSSGVTITWSHHAMKSGNFFNSLLGLILTILLGGMFLVLQIVEYFNGQFSINDTAWGSSFYISTGFHGSHVMMGLSLLIICLFRLKKNHFISNHHTGFFLTIMYWHFVDVVWVFLYILYYVFPNI